MTYIHILIFIAFLGLVWLPNWLLLVWGIPLLRLEPTALVSLGEADIRIYDVLIFAIILKVSCFVAVSKRLVHSYLYPPIGVFLAVILLATIVSYYRFGPEIFSREIIAFIRFIALFVVLVLTAHSINTYRQMRLSEKCLSVFGYAVTSSIYLGFILYPFGIEVGEVGADEQIVRTFGILGDQVGFLLPFFLYRELIARRIITAGFFGIAILLTGTRGTLAALAVGLLIMPLLSVQNKYAWTRRCMTMLLIGIVIMGVILSFDPGGMWTRLRDPERLYSGLTARGTTVMLATEVFLDNVLTGVGFSGFRFAALDYAMPVVFSQQLNYSPILIATTANQYLQVATDAGILGLMTFLWMMSRCLQILREARAVAPEKIRPSFEAAYIWLWSLLIGAQSVAWMLPDMTLSYILCIILGMAVATKAIQQEGMNAAIAVRNAIKGEAA